MCVGEQHPAVALRDGEQPHESGRAEAEEDVHRRRKAGKASAYRSQAASCRRGPINRNQSRFHGNERCRRFDIERLYMWGGQGISVVASIGQ